MQSKKKNNSQKQIKKYIKSRTFHRVIIGLLTIIAAFFIVENGAEPKRYKITVGEKSNYDISAPRDVENRLKTEQLAAEAANAVTPVMTRLDYVPIDVLNEAYDFVTNIEKARESVTKSLQDQGITKKDSDYKEKLETEQAVAAKVLSVNIGRMGVPLTGEQIKYLVSKVTDEELDLFKKLTSGFLSSIMKEEINDSNLSQKVYNLQAKYQDTFISLELKNIGSVLVNSILKPNSVVDKELTEKKKQEAYKLALDNRQIIAKGSRIVSYGDIVTEDKLEVLKELNLVETGKSNYMFSAGILGVILLLSAIFLLYMKFYYKKMLYDRNNLLLTCVIMIMTLLLARVVSIYSALLIPIFIAPLLISILLDLRLAILVNFILSVTISFMVNGDRDFMLMSLISGTFAAFVISRANQRSRMSAAGLMLGLFNALIIIFLGLLNKSGIKAVAYNGLIVLLNGIISTIFTIGMLPFLESTFNIITPLKLLELANPNQPLFKRLLIEAPGTYHHSLMVGNLAEVATEAINGNALLARVGAYYHDIGKLKRPNFFKENQMGDNPHDRMTANLSTLVITSHTHDGLEIADKYKIPLAIKDIISQHHGNTLVAYFYHKAAKSEKAEEVRPEDYRYPGPRPSSKEAAVVMLADSVEAAVRSMVDKTEGKIEGLIRKIIKEKLDDGQLNLCELTLKDLDDIAKAFMRVFSGYFHEREEYPEVKMRKSLEEDKVKGVQKVEDVIVAETAAAAETSADVENNSADESSDISDNKTCGEKEDSNEINATRVEDACEAACADRAGSNGKSSGGNGTGVD